MQPAAKGKFGSNAFRVGALAAATLWPTIAHAQTVGDDYWLEASYFLPKVDSDIQVTRTGSTTPGSEIDLETVFGFDDREGLPAISAGARITRNLVVTAEYFALGRDAESTLDRTIVIEDVTYPIMAQVQTGFDSDVYRFTIGYSFYHTDTVEVGGAIGVHATDFDFSITGTGSVGGAPPVTGAVRREEFLAPIPTLGLYGSVEIAKNLTLGGRLDYLSLNIGDYDGKLTNTQVAVGYQVLENVAVGALYRYVNYRVDVEKTNYTGRFQYQFNGPALFLRGRI